MMWASLLLLACVFMRKRDMAMSAKQPWHVGPVPHMDPTRVVDAWLTYFSTVTDEEAFEFFVTYQKNRSAQVDAAGMLDNRGLITTFRRLGTLGRFKATVLETSLVTALERKKDRKLNCTRLNDIMFAKVVCAKLSTMLAHSRYVSARMDLLMQQLPHDRHMEWESFCKDTYM